MNAATPRTDMAVTFGAKALVAEAMRLEMELADAERKLANAKAADNSFFSPTPEPYEKQP